jgi:hypothetical protein
MQPLPSKRVHIEIIGGDADGLFLDSQSTNSQERELVEGMLYMTNNGEIGQGWRGVSLTNLREIQAGISGRKSAPDFMHEYRVVERIEEESEILIRMRYHGRKLPHPKPKEQ